jgi:hypothetical protein
MRGRGSCFEIFEEDALIVKIIMTLVMLIIFLAQRWIAEDGCSYGSFGSLFEANWKPTLFSLICWYGLTRIGPQYVLCAAIGIVIWAAILFITFDGRTCRGNW